MRIVEVETTGRKIRRTWSYEKKNVLPEVQEKPSGTASSSSTSTTKTESEINLMENNSYKSKYSSPLAHRIKQNRIDQRERLHMN